MSAGAQAIRDAFRQALETLNLSRTMGTFWDELEEDLAKDITRVYAAHHPATGTPLRPLPPALAALFMCLATLEASGDAMSHAYGLRRRVVSNIRRGCWDTVVCSCGLCLEEWTY